MFLQEDSQLLIHVQQFLFNLRSSDDLAIDLGEHVFNARSALSLVVSTTEEPQKSRSSSLYIARDIMSAHILPRCVLFSALAIITLSSQLLRSSYPFQFCLPVPQPSHAKKKVQTYPTPTPPMRHTPPIDPRLSRDLPICPLQTHIPRTLDALT
jgi:hypothetical protein